GDAVARGEHQVRGDQRAATMARGAAAAEVQGQPHDAGGALVELPADDGLPGLPELERSLGGSRLRAGATGRAERQREPRHADQRQPRDALRRQRWCESHTSLQGKTTSLNALGIIGKTRTYNAP